MSPRNVGPYRCKLFDVKLTMMAGYNFYRGAHVARTAASLRVLISVALLCGLTLAAVDGDHITSERLPRGWDETAYLNDVCTDRLIFTEQGFVQFANGLRRRRIVSSRGTVWLHFL